MSENSSSNLGSKVTCLKVMCGFSHGSTANEDQDVDEVVSDPIPSEKFLSVYKQRIRQGRLSIEFQALSRNQEHHSTQAALRNVLLNNKQDTVPYDHSRVIVWDGTEVLATDYYNASYIDGYSGPREYIAGQDFVMTGPSGQCLVSFWHMVWQERVTCIVMATGLFENAVQQCDMYWTDHIRTHAQHGRVHVWHERSTRLAKLNIRTFKIQKEGSGETRLVTHYEMVGFHEDSPDPGLLLEVRRRVHSRPGRQTGPVLVHCSQTDLEDDINIENRGISAWHRCGGGRTAMFIAVDVCLHQLRAEDKIDVYSTVLHLRRFRKNMVRTLNQYTQIYRTLAMHVQCRTTVYPADTLPEIFHLLQVPGSDSRRPRLEEEFQNLQSLAPELSVGDCASGHRLENRHKNRDIMMLPPDNARPYLTTTDCGDSGTDFINAVYVDGYLSENSYIVTQWPMRRTTGDFWRLMFDFKMVSIVLMNDPQKFSRSYPRFWPKNVNQVASYGPVNVRYVSCERGTYILTRTFAIKKTMNNLEKNEPRQAEMIVRMFQVLSSSRHDCDTYTLGHSNYPYNVFYDHSQSRSGFKDNGRRWRGSKSVKIQSKSLLEVMEQTSDWQKRNRSRQPVCVISKDGCSLAGIYCAVDVCSDQIKVEAEVDVFSAVRLIQRNRPQLVPRTEEYHFIYNFMSEFILRSKSKPDFRIPEASSGLNSCSSGLGCSATPVAPHCAVNDGPSAAAKLDDLMTFHSNSQHVRNEDLRLWQKCGTRDRKNLCCAGHYHDSNNKQSSESSTSGSEVLHRLDCERSNCFLVDDLCQRSAHTHDSCNNPSTFGRNAANSHTQPFSHEIQNKRTTVFKNLLENGNILSSMTSEKSDEYSNEVTSRCVLDDSDFGENTSSCGLRIPLSSEAGQPAKLSPPNATAETNGSILSCFNSPRMNPTVRPDSLCKNGLTCQSSKP